MVIRLKMNLRPLGLECSTADRWQERSLRALSNIFSRTCERSSRRITRSSGSLPAAFRFLAFETRTWLIPSFSFGAGPSSKYECLCPLGSSVIPHHLCTILERLGPVENMALIVSQNLTIARTWKRLMFSPVPLSKGVGPLMNLDCRTVPVFSSLCLQEKS
jgi:hypothetical protein